MTLSDFCIRRPVFASVLSLLIVVLGLASLLRLPVRELPDVDSAVVSVLTTYTGAAPGIVDTEITELVEGAVAGIAGIKTISSESRRGRGRTVIEFEPGRDIDEAANDVRDAVARVRGDLPDEADEPQITKSDSDSDPVMRIAITSDRLSAAEITDYADRFIVDRLATLEGVAQVEVFGERRFAIRIWLDRRAMAARNLTVADVEDALRRNNVELPAGELKSTNRQFTVRTESRLSTVAEFERIVVASVAGYPIRLADIARVVRGVEDDDMIVRSDNVEAVGLGVLRQSQANTIAISNAVRDQLELIRRNLPAGMEVSIGSDDAVFIKQSIHGVVEALGIAVVLVVLVIFAFLASARATLVPAITIPVAVIGSFVGVYALGFSINVLTLLALILAIGIVVDDAIVVLENIQRRVEAGENPLVAGVLGTRQVTFAVIATSLTLIAVFVPISFLEGNVGRLFTEFGFVLAVAVAISTLVALTACPVLCTRVLRHDPSPGLATRILERCLGALTRGYRAALAGALAAPVLVLTLALLASGGSFLLYRALPQELVPSEDRGVFFIPVSAPQGATVAYTDAETKKVEQIVDPLRSSGEAARIFAIAGRRNEPHEAFVVVRLADWAERARPQQEIVRSLIPELAQISGARTFPVNPAGLGLRGSRTPLQVVIGGPDYQSVTEWSTRILRRAEANPGLLNLETDFERNQPQFDVRIDRAKADDLDIGVETIAETLQTMLASREITTYVDRGREYPVIVQARAEDRRTPTDLANIFVRSGASGELTPLTALVSLGEGAAAPSLRRYDRLPSVTISASLAEGYDLGSAIRYMQEVAAETLPAEAQLGFAGQSQQFLETSGGVAVTFALALLIVFLVLAAQFESFLHPLIIMLSVPLAVSGALLSLWLTGNSLNIYSQIGIILLIGLMAKNGILIVEFANQLRDQGHSVRDAILEGSVLRFRPIVMTVVSTILGAVPLALATGAGAESRSAIGIVVIGGLGIASALTLFVTPVLYDLLARFTRSTNAVERDLAAALAARTTQPAE
ncbi:MAG TPA: efflux RND transporter permease subunit [Geminicoccaceae bacterium]|nr:efflux RND transporter permease subunit [Geminicoccaceae bacterium]